MKQIILSIILVGAFISTFGQTSQNALNFDGSDDFVQTSYAGIAGSGARTIEAWIKTNENSDPGTSGVQHVIADYGTFVTGGRFTFNVLWANAIRIEVGGSGLSGQTAVNDGNWHHVAVTYDPTATNNYSLYVDGSLDTSGNISTTTNTVLGIDLRIGKRVDNARYWAGEIDEVRFWNYAKTASQIDSLNDFELCPNQTGLVAYYRLNQGTASGNNFSTTTANNSISSSGNGTLTNFGLSGTTSNWVSGCGITLAPDTTVIVDTTVCGGFVSPQGKVIIFTGSVIDIHTASSGCDSLIKYNVTVKQNSFIYQNIVACDSFRTSLGVLKTGSEVYTENYTNIAGCDSVVQTTLTINRTNKDTISAFRCDLYTSPTGKIYTLSGNYNDTLISSQNCDSIVTINLVIVEKSYVTRFDTACTDFTGPKGITYTVSGTYIDTLTNSNGCDSIITTHLVINQPSSIDIAKTACDSFISNSGTNKWYISGYFTETLTNQAQCDSFINYNITINYATTSSLTFNECEAFSAPSGQQIFESGIYYDLLTNILGCDSNITLNVTITNNDPIATKNGENLEANSSTLNYQWLDCDNAYSAVSNASGFIFRPSKSGNYAVEVTENNCKDTSDCVNYPSTAHIDTPFIFNNNIVPNPALNSFKIQTQIEVFEYAIINQIGQILQTGRGVANQDIQLNALSTGTYYVRITGFMSTEYNKLMIR